MSEKLQNIAEQFEAMKIDVDQPFRFRCTMCGECCVGRRDILLNPKDIYGMAEELGLTPKEFIGEYGEAYIGRDSRTPVVRLKPQGAGEVCPLLAGKRCSLQKRKPTVCALFPIGRILELEADSLWEKEATTARIRYIFTDPGCGDYGEVHTVREWLGRFGISLEDEFFIKWQGTVLRMSQIFREIEGAAEKDFMEMVWSAAFVGLYLNYDMEKAFMPQFERNRREVLNLLCAAPLEESGGRNE